METLKLICNVARFRSVSQAAQEHGITQSAASQRISHFERKLGARLIDRSVRPLELTPAGEVFVREVQSILSRYEQLQGKVRTLGAQPHGLVRVMAIYSAGIDLMQQVAAGFEQAYPHVRVMLDYRPLDEVHEAVLDQRCDLGVVSYPQRLRDVAFEHLRDETMVVVCRPDHALASRHAIDASELAQLTDCRMAAFDASLPVGRRVRQYLKQHGVTMQTGSTFDNIDSIKNAVSLTDQVSILPKRTVWREWQAGVLAMVALRPALVRPLGVIHVKHGRRGAALTPAAQTFRDYLLKQAGPGAKMPQMPERSEVDAGQASTDHTENHTQDQDAPMVHAAATHQDQIVHQVAATAGAIASSVASEDTPA